MRVVRTDTRAHEGRSTRGPRALAVIEIGDIRGCRRMRELNGAYAWSRPETAPKTSGTGTISIANCNQPKA